MTNNYLFKVYEANGDKYFLEDFSLDGAIAMAEELRSNDEVFDVLKEEAEGELVEVKESWARS